MSVETAPSFACASCGREFRWKASIAGKSAKCGCGSAVKVPAVEPGKESPAAEPDGENDIFGQLQAVVAAAPVTLPPPVPGQDLDVAPAPAPRKKSGPARAAPAGKPANTRSNNPRFHQRGGIGPTQAEIEESRNQAFWGRPKDKVVPLITIGVSSAIIFGMAAFQYHSGLLLAVVMVYSLVSVAGLVIAAFVAAAVGGISFGIMGIAMMRLAAISFACTALDALMVFGGLWWLVFLRGTLTYAIFTFGLMGFFELDYGETRVVAFVSVVLKWVLRLGLMAVIGLVAGSANHDGDDDEAPAVHSGRHSYMLRQEKGDSSKDTSADTSKSADEKDDAGNK